MEKHGIFFFSDCGIDPEIEKIDKKWVALQKLYPKTIIINPEKKGIYSSFRRVIMGCDFLIASEMNGTITYNVYREISEALKHKIPAFVIRESGDSFSFYKIGNLKRLTEQKSTQVYAKIVAREPDGGGFTEINRNLLSKPSEVFSMTNHN